MSKIIIIILYILISTIAVVGAEESKLIFFIDQYLNKEGSGNCFNTSLLSIGAWTTERYSYSEELKFWIESQLCKRKSWRSRQKGDIVVIAKKGKLIHAFTYLSDNRSFTKNGRSNFKLDSVQEIFSLYLGKKNVYRCISWENYINSQKLPRDLTALIKRLTDIDHSISTRNFKLQATDVLNIATEIELIANVSADLFYDKNSFIYQSIKIKTESVRKGLSFAFSKADDNLNYDDEATFAKIESFFNYVL